MLIRVFLSTIEGGSGYSFPACAEDPDLTGHLILDGNGILTGQVCSPEMDLLSVCCRFQTGSDKRMKIQSLYLSDELIKRPMT